MTDVVSVRFVNRGKKYFFDPKNLTLSAGDRIIVETAKGLDIGVCAEGNHPVDDEIIVKPLRPVVRHASAEDLRLDEANKRLEGEAFGICKEKIVQHGLDMKLVGVECGFEGNKILFFFTSDGRVDFRELVKDLASIFRMRIELRQIGVRDETKLMGGLGICGRPYCCSQFLNEFEPVSTKMAKTQSMSLNPTKISGSCGRLMCCLRYEQEAYEALVKTIPKNGAFVQTTGGYGNVVQSNVLRQKVKVRLDGEGEQEIKVFEAEQVAAIPGGRPKAGDPMPDVLRYVAPTEAEPELLSEDPWKAPTLFADGQSEQADETSEAPEKKNRNSRGHRGRKKTGNGNKSQGGAPSAQQAGQAPPKAAQKPQQTKPPETARAGDAKAPKKNNGRNRRHRPRKTSGEGGENSTK